MTTLPDITAWSLKAKVQHPNKTPFVVIDYLQLARLGIREIDNHLSETKRVSTLAVACKDLARQTGAAVIALSSVTKEAERDSNKEGEVFVTGARDSLAIIHAADGVLTLQSSQTQVKDESEESIDPWTFLGKQLERTGQGAAGNVLSKSLQRLDEDYPANGENCAVRARISLVRHRGSTGDVPVYYHRAFHRMDEVELKGLPIIEDGAGSLPGDVVDVFQNYKGKETALTTRSESTDKAGVIEQKEAFSGSLPLSPSIPNTTLLSVEATLDYRVITNHQEALSSIAALAERGEWVALDLETTGLSPVEGHQARLIQLAPTEGPVLVIDLLEVGGLHSLKESLQKIKAVAHNAVFDMKFLKASDISLTLDCTLIANHILTGNMAKLSEICHQYLGVTLDKTEQVSDWSHGLTQSQLHYAAADAYYTLRIFPRLMNDIQERRSTLVYSLCKNAQEAVVDMALEGMPFDAVEQNILLENLEKERNIHKNHLTTALGNINPNSGTQLGQWLTDVLGGDLSEGCKKWPKTGGGKLATGVDDLLKGLKLLPEDQQNLIKNTLLPYKEKEKLLNTFGSNLGKHISLSTGRLYANFTLCGTKTGRFSCRSPNLQNIPRDNAFRALFKAPEGRTFVLADYSQIELRVGAIVAEEQTLLEVFQQGKDIHAITAAKLLNKKPEEVTKQERQLAKPVNFGLLYGQSAKGLKNKAFNEYEVDMSEEEANSYRSSWFKAYPGIASWHTKTAMKSHRSMSVRTPAGREINFSASKEKEDHYTKHKAFNYPIQGGAAEVMLAALGKLPSLLSGLDAKPIAVIHDELIIESSLSDAPDVQRVLEEAMTQGMLEIFPEASTLGLVEAKIVSSWADK